MSNYNQNIRQEFNLQPPQKLLRKNIRATRKILLVDIWGQLGGKKNGLKTNLKLLGWMNYPNSQMKLCLVLKKELPSCPCPKQKLSCGMFWKPLLLQTVLPCRQMQNHFKRSFNAIYISSRKSTVEIQRIGIPNVLFLHHQKKRSQSLMAKLQTDGSPSNFSCQECQVLKWSLSKFQNELDLKTAECIDLHSCLDLQKESFEKRMKGALQKIFNLEKQLQDFEQKHGDLQEELLPTRGKTNSYQKKFLSKCAAISVYLSCTTGNFKAIM